MHTPQQRTAIETVDRSLLVAAGAGTGKTTVLVQRFLHLLSEPGATLEQIVAITFTEKAARTMRERLRRAIESRAADSGASSPWQAHRRALASLNVSTIHGLCARLLRENAIAAHLDPRFGVLDEQAMLLLQGEAVEQSLAALAEEGGDALRLLDHLTVYALRSEMGHLLRARTTLAPLFKALPDEVEALLAMWQAQREAAQQQAAAALAEDEALALLAATPICDPGDRLAPAVAAAQQAAVLLAAGEISGMRDLARIDLRGGTQAAWGGKEALAEIKEALKRARESAQALGEEGLLITEEEAALDREAAQALLRWRAIWHRLLATYDSLKAEQHALDFDDLELHAVRLLTRQPRPQRLAATLAGIRYLLVDEFQDTNAVQQQIVYALAPVESQCLFVVGDAKQSIYRFRQAQVSVFNRTGQDIARVTGEGALPLSHSFRTHRSLVAAQNHLFERLLAPQQGQHAAFEARPGPLSAARELPPDHPSDHAPVELTLLAAPEKGTSVETLRLHEARLLAERLHQLHRSAFPVYDRDLGDYRPFQFGDAAILFAATTSMPLYEEQFKAARLPYLTNAGRGYFDRPEVRDLQALLQATATPRDDLALATVLRSPLGLLSDETLFRLRWINPDGTLRPPKEPRPLQDALADPPPTDQPERVAEAGALMARLWSLARRVAVGELVQQALTISGYEALLALDDRARGERQLNNVQKFAEIAREWGGASLSDFLARLRVLKANEVREGEALAAAPEGGAVQLMTIHAAKGLEFPVVALVDLSRAPRLRDDDLVIGEPGYGLAYRLKDEGGEPVKPPRSRWIASIQARMARAEHARLLYVACTRAADLLLLSGTLSRLPKESWLAAILAAWAIESGGAQEERVRFEGFGLRVRRPPLPEQMPYPAEPVPPPERRRVALPPLAQPLPWLASQDPDEVPTLRFTAW